MVKRRGLGTWFWFAAGVAALGGLTWAQGPQRTPPKPPAVAGDKTQAAASAEHTEKKASKSKQADLPTAAAPDLAVDAVLATKPSTPSELIRAGKTLADLRRPDLAKEHFRRVLAAKLDSKSLAALADEFGPATFSAMALRRDLAPEGKLLSDAVLGAKNQQLQDPQRIARLIEDLADPSPKVRGLAVAGLQDAGAAAVAPLLAVLGDSQRAAHHGAARAALLALGSSAHGPLAAAVDAANPRLAVEAVRLLGESQTVWPSYFLLRPCCDEKANAEVRAAARAAATRIWRREPTADEAARMLADLARRLSQGAEPMVEDDSGQVLIWTWNDAKKQAVSRAYAPREAARWFAARFARDAYAILPDRNEILLLHLATALEQVAHEKGLDDFSAAVKSPAANQVAGMGEDAVERLLGFAMQNGQSAAAATAARILGSMPGAERLLCGVAQPSPLALATRHPDRRLRYAAVEAIMRVRPRGPFSGASYVTEAIQFVAATRGVKRALVVSPRREEPMRLATHLVRLGYEPDTASTGRELIRKALESPDYELVLIDAITSYPTVDEVVQSLRRDGRTALLPVGVLAAAGDLERAKHMVRNDSRAEVFSRPHDLSTVSWQIERLAALGGDLLSPAERKRQAGMALDWLAELSQTPGGWFDMSRVETTVLGALTSPDLAAKACAVLGRLGTPRAQQALVDVASGKTIPLADRRAALDAFRTAVQQRGILLTTAKIQLQYDRYNASAQDDPATQAVLGAILDCLEAPTRPAQQARDSENIAPHMAQGSDKPES